MSATTPQERLDVVYGAYADAYRRRFADLKEATSERQAKDILANVRVLESVYLQAAVDALDASGPAVESAYEDARTARSAIEDAYTAAKAIGEKIRLVAAGAKAAGELVKKAQA